MTEQLDGIEQTWRAVDLSQSEIPKTVSHYLDEPARRNRTNIQFDGATLELLPNGRFTRRTYYSEWLSIDYAAGSPFELRYRFSDYDHGTWSRNGDQIVLTSGWVQYQVVHGTILENGTIRLQHALTPGDLLVDVGYAPGQ